METNRKQKIIRLEGRIVSFYWDGKEHIGEITKELENGLYFQYICRNRPRSEYFKELEREFFKWEEISQFGTLTRSGKLKTIDHPKLNPNNQKYEH